VEWLARVGFVAKGLLYGTVGTLAACAGLGNGGETTDTRGAMGQLVTLPFGELVLFGIAVGLVGYGVWRIVEGFADPDNRGSDAKGLTLRASFVVRGLLHLLLAWSAAKFALDMPSSFSIGPGVPGGSASSGESEQATAYALSFPAGEWIVMAIAACIGGFGAWQVIRAFRAKLNRNVSKGEIAQEGGAWLIVVSRIGIAARGLVFMAIAWLLGKAGLQNDASQSGGVDQGLDVFANLGRIPLIAIGAGLVAYGVYQLLSARYRRIRV
jgi:hypothetical protein